MLIPWIALAESPWQGPRPAVTQSELPEYISDAIRERLNDPASMEVISWTLPELKTISYKGSTRGVWNVIVTIRARNSYNGFVKIQWGIGIKNEQVSFCQSIR